MQSETRHLSMKSSHGMHRRSLILPMFISCCVLGIRVDVRIQRHRGEQKTNPVHREQCGGGKKKKSFIMGNLISYQNHNVKLGVAK